MQTDFATMTAPPRVKKKPGALAKPAVDGVETLERMKHWPSLKAQWLGRKVQIYSAEHASYWRANGQGYTLIKAEAGIYDFHDAWDRTSHCDPSKKIRYVHIP
jgi:hypothetical protein